jgi:3-deoxy-D-manno-octulosonic acid kinase
MLIDAQLDSIVPGRLPFEPALGGEPNGREATSRGRGSSWFISSGQHRWVLRHYRRGGFFAPLLGDRYLWLGERRVRAFAEFELLARLHAEGLPVPRPLAARYERSGLIYRCDLLMERITGAVPLSVSLSERPLSERLWRRIGAAVARLHAAGVDHADLNAHNLLIDAAGTVSVIDFDRSRLRAPGRWRLRNLERLQRSLRKVGRTLPPGHIPAGSWEWVLAGYAGAD